MGKTKLKIGLPDTVAGMESSDYKERFVAEYEQTAIRMYKLKDMIQEAINGELSFELTCPLEILVNQLGYMIALCQIYEDRAAIEGIELEDPAEGDGWSLSGARIEEESDE